MRAEDIPPAADFIHGYNVIGMRRTRKENEMAKLTFKTDLCKGCGLCVDACPKKVLRLATEKINKKGHHPVEAENESACIACAFCATMCPDCIITIEKE